ncbi:VpaChn25_0724 family phage protein [Marivivens aquimaris]|uniref:VpaChn25_0724 family phage protein n=1 Tax=Marivivens aquimaris TaxID=2774876 RepID=UPI00187EBF17|nr:hypothetical protein [Marivivens aquimaris]
MSNFAEALQQHRRLAILRHLENCPEYTCNISILTDVLYSLGIPSTRDQTITDVMWLNENSFVTATDHGAGFFVVVATGRGIEIAKNRATHPGIQRPSAGF